jgi:hypothetical protein
MDQESPRYYAPDRCAWCGGYALFSSEACEMSLCPLHKVCPECEHDEYVQPISQGN